MNAQRVNQALDILDKEERANRRAYKFLRGAFFGFLGILACILLLAISREIWPEQSATIELPHILLTFFALLFAIVLCIAFLWELLLIWRNWRFERRYGAFDPAGRFQDTVIPVTWLGRLRWFAIAVLVAPTGALLLWFAIMIGGVALEYGEDDLLVEFILGTIGLALIAFAFTSRRRALLGKLEDVDRLRRVLSDVARQSETVPIHVSAENLNEVAKIEKAQIERDRFGAIASGMREEGSSDFSLLRSRRMLADAGRLNAQARIGIEEQAEMLRHVQKPSEAIWDESLKNWRLRVPDTDVEIAYVIDDENRTITLVSVNSGKREPALDLRNGGTNG